MNRNELFAYLISIGVTRHGAADIAEVLTGKHGGTVPQDVVRAAAMRYGKRHMM